MSEGSEQSGAGAEHTFFLKYWARMRGPLFDRPRNATIRAMACGELIALNRTASERRVRMGASRALQAHQGPRRPSHIPAREEALEAARRGCGLLRRIRRECTRLPFQQQADRVVEAIRSLDPDERDPFDTVVDYCWTEMLCGMLFAPEPEVRLRAARSLLCWTEPDARKLGRGNPDNLEEEERELLEHIRSAPASRDEPRPWGPAVDCAPEIQARGRDSP